MNPKMPTFWSLSRQNHCSHASTQAGAALITGLIILVLMSLIGITALRTTGLEERMAGHTRDRNLAFQAAEAALRNAEGYLTNPVVGPFNNKAPHASGLYEPRVPNPDFTSPETCTDTACRPWWDILDWDASDSAAYSGAIAGVSQQPRYIIEDVSGSVKCLASGCENVPPQSTPGGSVKFGAVPDVGMYRVTARGVGAQTDGAGNPLAVVVLQGYYKR